jgi:hypothetical protein
MKEGLYDACKTHKGAQVLYVVRLIVVLLLFSSSSFSKALAGETSNSLLEWRRTTLLEHRNVLRCPIRVEYRTDIPLRATWGESNARLRNAMGYPPFYPSPALPKKHTVHSCFDFFLALRML